MKNLFSLEKFARGRGGTPLINRKNKTINEDPYYDIHKEVDSYDGLGQNKNIFPATGLGGDPYTKHHKPPRHSTDRELNDSDLAYDLPKSDYQFISDGDQEPTMPGVRGPNQSRPRRCRPPKKFPDR